ncbi:hypothetical protein ACNKHP_11955 [Shigella boydii]
MDVIPASVIVYLPSGNILQVLLFAVLFGFASTVWAAVKTDSFLNVI